MIKHTRTHKDLCVRACSPSCRCTHPPCAPCCTQSSQAPRCRGTRCPPWSGSTPHPSQRSPAPAQALDTWPPPSWSASTAELEISDPKYHRGQCIPLLFLHLDCVVYCRELLYKSQASVQYEPPVQSPGLLPPRGQGHPPRPRGRDNEARGWVSDELILPHPGGGQSEVSQGQQGEAGSDEATGSRCYKTLHNNKCKYDGFCMNGH